MTTPKTPAAPPADEKPAGLPQEQLSEGDEQLLDTIWRKVAEQKKRPAPPKK